MSVTAARPPAPILAPVPQAAPTPADREPSPAAHPFAELLRQNRGQAPATAEPSRPAPRIEASEPPTNGSEAAGNEEATTPTNELSTRSDAARARARSAGSARAGTRTTNPSERSGRDGVAARERDDEDSAAPGDANAANAAGAVRPEAMRPIESEPRLRGSSGSQQPGDAGAGRGGATSSAVDAGGSSADAHGGALAGRLQGEAVASSDAGRASRAKDGGAPAAAASFAQALGEAKTLDQPTLAATGERPSLPAFDAALAPHEALPPAASAGDAAALATTLPTPVDSPEFASALGVQVSVFVREGVQHAELHLNPAETGPVSIAITLDGTQAHVEFGADLAATRQAIENGLPALASALRDAGFTLAGGGVAQHSRSGGGQGGDEPAGHGEARRAAARGSEAVAAVAPRTSHRIAAGGVDLYA